MRNLKLIDAVVALHEIKRLVEEECGICRVSIEIERCANQLHEMSLQDAKNSIIAGQVIQKAKE
jgi:hypothetical protein